MPLQGLSLGRMFDAVVCVDVMENVPPEDWPQMLQRFREHLRPGGRLYATVETESPDRLRDAYAEGLAAGIPLIYGEVASEGYHFYPGRSEVLEWLATGGFTVCDEETGDGYWHLLCQA